MFQTYTFNLGKKSLLIWAINPTVKSIKRGLEILAKRLRLFLFSIQHEVSGYTFFLATFILYGCGFLLLL